ncbi:MAG: ABC-2 transporter permease [Lactobacillus sp.]|jgi:predicted permease|nr:ABC-2 transporter permease [Lactobacillus sp.]MCI2033301.1 ABC-2 transporter permease [Lactobacillus sp.]
MKGLWLKDWLLLKAQWLAAVITGVLAWGAMLVFRQTGIVVGMGIASLTMSLVMLATVSADQASHGLSFILTLPITARQYVAQKFALLLAVIGTTTLAMMALALGYRVYAHWALAPSTLLGICGSLALVIFLILGVTLSYQLRYGAERAQVAMSLLGGVVALLIGGGIAAVRYTTWGPKMWARLLSDYTTHGGLTVVAVLGLLAVIVWLGGRHFARPLAQ